MLIADRITKTLNDLPGTNTVTVALDVEGVLCSIEAQRPDVAIVDPHMAGREGVALLKNIKRRRPRALLIVLSNCVCPVHGRRCFEAGADYFLDKSNEFDRVPELIQTMQKIV